jgi:nucleoside-diphosphate-sugar epimerase
MAKKSVLITGGSGFIGRKLIKRLKDKGYDVSIYTDDVLNEEKLEKTVKGKDVVFHLAAVLDESDPSLYLVNVSGTWNVIKACRKARVKRLMYLSSVGVLGDAREPVKEDAPYKPATDYEKSKVDAEKIIIDSGVPYTILRCTIVYGKSTSWGNIFDSAKKGYPILGDGKNYWHLVYVDDVMDVIMLAMNSAKAENRVFNIAGPDVYTYEQTYGVICSALGVELPEKHIPLWLAKFFSLLHETKCKLLGKRPKVTKMRSSIDRLVRNRNVDTSKAKELLKWKPKYDLKTGMRKAVREIYGNSG